MTAPTSFATTYSIAPVLAKEGAVIVFKALRMACLQLPVTVIHICEMLPMPS